MMNMAHCRFSNTLEALQECWNHIDDKDLSEAERQSRAQLMRLVRQIASEEEGE